MFLKRKGYPEQGEVLLCSVKKILPHCVFVILEEFERREGLVHISEIAPGRIRNIRDYVKEGKTVVCKVLQIKRDKGHIDLSLRRVGTGLRVSKLTEVKQDAKAEKLLAFIGKRLDLNLAKTYALFGKKAIDSYGRLTLFFEAVVADGKGVLEHVGLSGKELETVYSIVTDKIKPQEVCLRAQLALETSESDGVVHIKKVLVDAAKKFDMSVSYVSAPKYAVEIIARDYKDAEDRLKQAVDFVTKGFSGTVELIRD